ncbi:Dyp-type peroxidase [Nocardioides carbamazepini]|uniref:Dyp-type peroxidase n=1 Tax=Nocardioides carbamazepini TaxID=2854259 RepID=UPI002149F218|nr:Dyp-type peroxidase [Nocardioides carbamazepini]MCR1784669.1 Dyp-type peroxidase [Nocardioides carbamazepini]
MGEERRPATSRRRLLAGSAAGLAVGGAGGFWAGTRPTDEPRTTPGAPAAAAGVETADGRGLPVPAAGPRQAGVDRPATPPRQLSFVVLGERAGTPLDRAGIAALLAGLGDEIRTLTASEAPDPRMPDGPGNLTVQVGIGAAWADLAETGLGDRVRLPTFRGSDALPGDLRDGDLVLAVAADDPALPDHVVDLLLTGMTGPTAPAGLRVLWAQRAFRSPGSGAVVRNPLGFRDGIIQPADAAAMDDSVWIAEGPAAGGTIGVVRRFSLDAAAFGTLDAEEQAAVIGRRPDGTPLSGGDPDGDVDLTAKTPHGEYLVPADSHARAAHPSFTGSPLMARRSYAIRVDGDGTAPRPGLLFWSFQNDVGVFARTQQRMDRVDRLMDFAAPTAELGYLVLPGFTADRPLGAGLFGT